MRNYIYSTSVKVTAPFALWSMPETKTDRISYPVPTYSGLLGMAKNVFWKPEIGVDVLAVKVLKNPIRHIAGIDHIQKNGDIRLSTQSYIVNPEYLVEIALYQVQEGDINAMLGKYSNMLERAIKSGGRMHVYLGSSECNAIVESHRFPWKDADSEMKGTIHLGHIFHHHDASTNKKYFIKNCVMEDGVIDFTKQEINEV